MPVALRWSTATTSASPSARRSRTAASMPSRSSSTLVATRSRRPSATTVLKCSSERWASRPRSARANFFEQRQGWGCQDPAPIFIVGLPRAGSTLLEQILASHSQVEGTMELADIPRLVSSLDLHASGARYPDVLALPSADNYRALRRGVHSRHAALPGRQQAVLHRQDAEQLPPRRPDPPDAAEREDHRRAARADGLLLQQLQAAVCERTAVHLQPRRHRPLLRDCTCG